METISVYLDHMFASLPKTPEVRHMKQELLSGMEEKYRELKEAGKSENEAIGIVISEFGNIEELTAELGIHAVEPERTVPMLTQHEAYDYMAAKRSAGLWVGLGIFFCASGVALLIILDTLFETTNDSERGSMLGLIGMFMLAAVGVVMFINSGMKLHRFKSLEQEFKLPYALKMEIRQAQAFFAPTYRFSLFTGVCLCVLSPILIFAFIYVNDDFGPYGVAIFLLSAAVAVFLLVYYGNIQGAYTKLLEGTILAAAKKEELNRKREM